MCPHDRIAIGWEMDWMYVNKFIVMFYIWKMEIGKWIGSTVINTYLTFLLGLENGESKINIIIALFPIPNFPFPISYFLFPIPSLSVFHIHKILCKCDKIIKFKVKILSSAKTISK